MARKLKKNHSLAYLHGVPTDNEHGLGGAATLFKTIACGIRRLILIDDGLESVQGEGYRRPDISSVEKKSIDAVVLTHGHLDHIGDLLFSYLSGIFKDDFVIWGSSQTREILALALDETWQRNLDSGSYDNVIKILDHFRVIPCRQEFEIVPGVLAYAVPAGHLPGALCIIIRTEDGKNVMFMGDTAWHNMGIVLGSKIPDDIPDEWLPDVLAVTDLTNPDLSLFDYELEKQWYIDFLIQKINEDKIVVNILFSVGKGQNMSIYARDSGIAPVYIDGSVTTFFNIFAQHHWSDLDLPISANGIVPIDGKRINRQTLLEGGGPLLINTPSGMGDFGSAPWYLVQGLPNPKFVIVKTGYASPTSQLGRLMKARKEGATEFNVVDNNGRITTVPIEAEIEEFRMTSHGGLHGLNVMCEKIVKRKKRKFELIVGTHASKAGVRTAATVLRPHVKSKSKFAVGNRGMIIEF